MDWGFTPTVHIVVSLDNHGNKEILAVLRDENTAKDLKDALVQANNKGDGAYSYDTIVKPVL